MMLHVHGWNTRHMFGLPYIRLVRLFFQLEQCFSLTTIQLEQCFSASFSQVLDQRTEPSAYGAICYVQKQVPEYARVILTLLYAGMYMHLAAAPTSSTRLPPE